MNPSVFAIHEKKPLLRNHLGQWLPDTNSLFYKMKLFLQKHPDAPNRILYQLFIQDDPPFQKKQRIREYKSKILKILNLKNQTKKEINQYVRNELKLQKQFLKLTGKHLDF